MVKKLLHTRYRVADLDKTVTFYRDVLGLEETRRHTSGRGSQLVFFKAPGSDEEIEICKFDQSGPVMVRSEEHTSELQSPCNLVCRLLLEKKKTNTHISRKAKY